MVGARIDDAMDDEAMRAARRSCGEYTGVDQDVSHETYHAGALEFPQSGERFEGVENFREWRRAYPAKVQVEIGRIRGRGDLWVMELRGRYDDGPWGYGVSILEFRGDKGPW